MGIMFLPRGLCLLYKASFRRNSFYTSCPLQQKPFEPEAFGTKILSHQSPLQQTFLQQILEHKNGFYTTNLLDQSLLTTKAFHRENYCTSSHSLHDPSKKIIQYTNEFWAQTQFRPETYSPATFNLHSSWLEDDLDMTTTKLRLERHD